LSAWHRYAHIAQAIIDIAARLHQGKPVSDKYIWKDARIELFAVTDEGFTEDYQLQAFAISVAVNGWLELGGVRPYFLWEGGRPPTVTLGPAILWWFKPASRAYMLRIMPHLQGTTLFGALGVQLLMAVSRAAGFAVCSACGKVYMPKRRPNPKRRRYCGRCGVKAAWRDAQLRRRAKLAERGTQGN
jgi:hypothetical protein